MIPLRRCWSFTETTSTSASGVHPAMQAQAKALDVSEMFDDIAAMSDMRMLTTAVRIVDADDVRPVRRRRTTATTSSAGHVSGRMELLRTDRWR
jgi:hypothetical protein